MHKTSITWNSKNDHTKLVLNMHMDWTLLKPSSPRHGYGGGARAAHSSALFLPKLKSSRTYKTIRRQVVEAR